MTTYFVFGFIFSYFLIALAQGRGALKKEDKKYILFSFIIIAALWPLSWIYLLYELIWGEE